MEESQKNLEVTAGELVMADHIDLPSLARLHDCFLQLGESVAEECPYLHDTVKGAAGLTEKMVVGDVPDPDAAMQTLRSVVDSLLSVIRDSRTLAETEFPEGFVPNGAATKQLSETCRTQASAVSSSRTRQEVEPDAGGGDAEIRVPSINLNGVDTSLLGEFVSEAREHCSTAEQTMMDMETGEDRESAINAIFRAFHTIKGAAGFLDLGPIGMLAHESETLLDEIRKGTHAVDDRTTDVIFESIDVMRRLLDLVEAGLRTGGTVEAPDNFVSTLRHVQKVVRNEPIEGEGDGTKRVGDILIDMGATTQDEIDAAIADRDDPDERLGETLVKKGVVRAKAVAHALREQTQARQTAAPKQGGNTVKEMVRIDTERLDRLMDTLGELVIAESMISQDAEFRSVASERLGKNVSHLSKITRELQEMSMAFRLVPVKPTFQKLARAVRDLTKKSGKKVDLVLSGEETEVDRNMIEHIGDPLMHMIRNAMDHALETPDERVANGKQETGTIELSAYQKGGSIHFDINDDGRGLNSEAILSKARERNLIDGNREMSPEEIHNLIFLPGFSTAKKITDVSGRGVGMDVVKKNVDAMRGHITIDSIQGKGTKFTIKLPLTLASIEGLLVQVGKERLIIPAMSVIESVNLDPAMISTVGADFRMIDLRGKLVPLVDSSEWLGFPPTKKAKGMNVVVVIEDSGRSIGFVVDEVLGKHQFVIKSLGPMFAAQRWVSGGAILSDGTVGLILDVSALVYQTESFAGRFEGVGAARRSAVDKIDSKVTVADTEPAEAAPALGK
jgi:two-component system chemotaxis sensor kinase CheA